MKPFIIFIIILCILNLLLFIKFLFRRYKKCEEKYIKKYKIFIDNSSNNYTPHIVKYILKALNVYEIVDNKDDSDIYVHHITNNDFMKDKINIVISGESHKLNDKVDLCIGPILQQNSKYNIYYPQFYSSLFEHRKSIDNKDYIVNKKTKFCAYMYSTHHDHRVKYFELLSKYKHVDALGSSCKNTDIETSRHINNETETYNDIALDLYKDYKFVIAMENNYVDGYNTEKIINPIIANSIPIYWGDTKVFDYINKKRVIYIPDYTDGELLNLIKKLDEDDIEYKKIIDEPIYLNNKKPDEIERELEQNITVILFKVILSFKF